MITRLTSTIQIASYKFAYTASEIENANTSINEGNKYKVSIDTLYTSSEYLSHDMTQNDNVTFIAHYEVCQSTYDSSIKAPFDSSIKAPLDSSNSNNNRDGSRDDGTYEQNPSI
jgi:hypothetical protein